MRESYGFSALFETLNAERQLAMSNDVINSIAFGTMESASVVGDDIVSALGISEDGIETGADDFMDEVDDTIDEPDLQKLDNTLDDIIGTEDDDVAMEMLDSCLESLIGV